jgi:predicted nucleic acid-binding protein
LVWVFFDASALAKRYAPEIGSDFINELFLQFPCEQMTVSMIGVSEIVAVLVRKHNDGRLPSELFASALLELNDEIIDNEVLSLTTVDDQLIFSSQQLIVQHNINATDAIILQSCLDLQQRLPEEDQLVLLSSDKRLLRAAQNNNVSVLDPEVANFSELQVLMNS